MKKIQISDITLKTLCKDRDVTLLFRDKTAIATCADSLGVDAIELPPVKNLREDTIIYKSIAQKVNSVLAIPVGFTKEDIGNAFECVKDAHAPRLQIELPVSTVQMEYTYHLKADKMLLKIAELCEEAKKLVSDVEFVALDATRADEDFLINAVKTAEKSGASLITFCDDAGTSLPEEIGAMVKKLKEEVKVPVFAQVSNNISMAVSCAIWAIKSGVDGVKCAMAGKETLTTGKISDALFVRGKDIGVETELKNTAIHANVDSLLSYIHKDVSDADVEVSEKKKILLDADSTIEQVAKAAEILGYDLSHEDLGKVQSGLVQVCSKKNSVDAKELEALIASFAMQAPSTYHLESYSTTSSNHALSMSQVTLKNGDELLTGVSTGDGPIDSAFRAIEQSIGHHYELDDFQVQALTEGKEALGSAIVRLRNNGKLYSGNGISTDIVAASIRAYINALNKIVFEEE